MKQIVCTEQFSTRVILFDAEREDWNGPDTMLWTFDPLYHKDIKPEQLRLFCAFSEVKPVLNMTHLLITASGGGVCLVRIEDKKVVFFGHGGNNPHSAELLPDGNIVSISSSGNNLRLFHVRENRYEDFELEYGHGAVWDRKRNCLWTSGLYGITRWEYDGRTLKRCENCNPFPDDKKFYGHDLFPVYGEDKLYLTGENMAIFDPERGAIESLNPILKLKSISRNQEGDVLVTVPNEAWWTDTVSLLKNDEIIPYRTRKNMWFYKARWMMPNPFSYDE